MNTQFRRLRWAQMSVVTVGMLLFFSIASAEEIRYDRPNFRDPFVPLRNLTGSEAKGSEESILEGIVYDPKGGSYVIINGEIYREGEEVGGSMLVRIFADRIVLQRESQEMELWLHQEFLQKSNARERNTTSATALSP